MSGSGHDERLRSWGVSDGYWDTSGAWHRAPDSSVHAVLAAMAAEGSVHPPDPPQITVRVDHPLPPVPPGRLVLEDGESLNLIDGRLPAGLPPGYHALHTDKGVTVPLIVSPGLVPLPVRRAWGFSAQIYATRSSDSWGIGDLDDLRRLGEWSAKHGAGLLLVNPLHASHPAWPQQPSPYYAGSRCFLNPIYIAVERVPGAEVVAEVAPAATAGRALNQARLIDRDRVWELKSAALEAIYARFDGDPGFDRFLRLRGRLLEQFATYCALAEIHGPIWQQWPADVASPDAEGVARFVASGEGTRRVRYHCWLQWLLDVQLTTASRPVGLVHDLAVGVDPGGPDAWIWQRDFAPGMRVGAPPDEFNTQGQDWALPPLDPWQLRSGGYDQWIEALRAGLRHGAGLRVDHVMGLFRLFWIPQGAPPAAGVYVSYPHDDLLNILALEAHRAGAFIVGEDLGTVQDEVRRDLAERRVLSYRVWWFEERPPRDWPENALGTITTHDLPTIAGVLGGSDVEAQRQIGLSPNEESSTALQRKIVQRTGVDTPSAVEAAVEGVHADLAQAPCLLLAATLDDVLAVEERPNMPGTVDEWPNWSLALPHGLEEIEQNSLARRVAERLNARST